MTVTASRTLALTIPRFSRHVAALITRAHPTSIRDPVGALL